MNWIKRKPNKKAKLRRKADKLWTQIILSQNPKCECCGKPSLQAHHFYFKGSYPLLRYNLSNGVSLCLSCHFKLHFRDAKAIEEIIIKKRGQIWFKKIQKLSHINKTSFLTIGYYEQKIKVLSN